MMNRKAIGISVVIYWSIGIILFLTMIYGIYQAWDPIGGQVRTCPGECRESCEPGELQWSRTCKQSDGETVSGKVCCTSPGNFQPGEDPLNESEEDPLNESEEDPDFELEEGADPSIEVRHNSERVNNGETQVLEVGREYHYEVWGFGVQNGRCRIEMSYSPEGHLVQSGENMRWGQESFCIDRNLNQNESHRDVRRGRTNVLSNVFNPTSSHFDIGNYTLTIELLDSEDKVNQSVTIPFEVVERSKIGHGDVDPAFIQGDVSADFKLFGQEIEPKPGGSEFFTDFDIADFRESGESFITAEISGAGVIQCGYYVYDIQQQTVLIQSGVPCHTESTVVIPLDVSVLRHNKEYEVGFGLYDKRGDELIHYDMIFDFLDSDYRDPYLVAIINGQEIDSSVSHTGTVNLELDHLGLPLTSISIRAKVEESSLELFCRGNVKSYDSEQIIKSISLQRCSDLQESISVYEPSKYLLYLELRDPANQDTLDWVRATINVD